MYMSPALIWVNVVHVTVQKSKNVQYKNYKLYNASVMD